METLPECEATRWNALFTDIVPVGGSKRIGMEQIMNYVGIRREEVMAFGDGGNDIPMLDYAGIGVAMGMLLPRYKVMPISLLALWMRMGFFMPLSISVCCRKTQNDLIFREILCLRRWLFYGLRFCW